MLASISHFYLRFHLLDSSIFKYFFNILFVPIKSKKKSRGCDLHLTICPNLTGNEMSLKVVCLQISPVFAIIWIILSYDTIKD